MKQKKTALFQSVIALILCISMLMGTTFAWFTDSVTTGINTIAAGVLDVELYHSNAAVADERVDTNTKLFMDLNGNPILWEPGVVSYENLRITNAGDLALAYQLALNTDNENFVVEESGAQYGLSQILKVGFVEGGITATDRAGVVASVEEGNWTTLASFVRSGALLPEGEGESEKTWGVVIYWEPGENDNYWNLNNGKQLNEGEVLMIDLGVKLIATQEGYESDAFGSDYDAEAKLDVFPVFVAPGSTTTTVVPNDQNQVASGLEMTAGQVSASIPAGVQLAAGTTELTMSVSEMNQSGANISLGVNEAMRSLDVHIEGVAEDNTVPMIITLKEIAPVGLNMGNYKLYHVENGQTKEMSLVEEFTAHNQFKYNPATGDVTLYMATFSEVALVADTENAWNGDFDYSWYTDKKSPYAIANADQLAAFGAIVGGMKEVIGNDGGKYFYSENVIQDSFDGKTVKLIADINLGDKESENNPDLIFYPIGYYNSEGTYERTNTAITSGLRNFEGTFDGNGHTISNFYHNTWEMKGDHDWYSPEEQYYRDGMGLFGRIYGGTVKNLTIKNFSSDGEIATTGCVAAYADGATFENIAIFDCNPRVYNIGNGGIVGCVGWYAKEAGKLTTLKNITVDNSNKISALWGSYDVACGGLVGQYYPTSGQSSANYPTNAGIEMVNCHVAAQMDVYNDVCGNYQYYAYRYAGMMIGSIRENTKTEDGKYVIPDMTGITATGCTVNYGDWNDYYYCEFEKNGHPSYSGPDDYKFSRVPDSELEFTDSNGNGRVDADERTSVTGCNHKHTDAENNQAIYLPFHQLFTGYGWGVNSIGLEKYNGIVTNLDISEGEQEESVEKFATKFTGDFLYRVGNKNEFTIGNLFAAAPKLDENGNELKDENGNVIYWDINDPGVYVRVDKHYDDQNVTCKFTANTTNWAKGTLKFEGTGVVDIVIQDYDYCKPTVLHLEVVDAYNAAPDNSIRSAESYDVALIGNIGSNSLTVSNGHTFSGNGFKVNCAGKGYRLNVAGMYGGFIEVKDGGVLDNVQVFSDIYPVALLYSKEAKNYKNDDVSTTEKTYYNYQLSAVAITGNGSQIINSYVYGGRNNIYVGDGNVTIANTTTENGVLSNIQIKSSDASTVTLNNVTTIQNEVVSTYDSTKTMLGCGVLVGDNESVSNPNVIIKGEWNHYNWVTATNANNNSNSYAKDIITQALTYKDYLHENSNNEETVNLGMIFLNGHEAQIDDQRSVKDKYLLSNVTMNLTDPNTGMSGNVEGQVYSIGSGKGNTDGSAGEYIPGTNQGLKPTATKDETVGNNKDTNDGGDDTRYCYWDGDVLKLMYKESESAFVLDVANLVAFEKLGYSLVANATVAKNGAEVTANEGKVTFADAGNYVITYTVTDPYNYDINGIQLAKPLEWQFTYNVEVNVVESNGKNATITVQTNSFYGYYGSTGGWDPDYHYCIPFMNNVTITDYAEDGITESEFDVVSDISTITITGDKAAGTITLTYIDGRVLVVAVSGHSVGLGDTGNTISVKKYDGKLWICTDGASNNPTTGTWKVDSYKFTGNNGVPVEYTTTRTCNFDKDSTANSLQKSWSDFTNPIDNGGSDDSGSGGDECVTGNTLVALADGTNKRIDEVTYSDQLLVWDFYNGTYVAVPASIIWNHGYAEYDVTSLYFDDGTVVEMINSHGFFDVDNNNFVYLTEENAKDYIGHSFVKVDGNSYTTVKLVDYSVERKFTGCYSIQSAVYNNFVVENMFSMTTPDYEGWFDYFKINDDMKYDEEHMNQEIAKYGLCTYDEVSYLGTYEQYVALNAQYLKILIGRGVVTMDQVIEMLEKNS